MPSDIESRTIVLGSIGRLDEIDLREQYQCLETSPDEKVVEAVFTPDGQDSALVIFTHEKFVTKALHLDHGDIEVTRPPTQMFSSVSATVHERLPRVVASPTVWQLVVEGLTRRYGVDIDDLVIQGSWLQVEMCRLTLMKIFCECLTRDVGSSEDHENATGRTSKTGSKERGPGVSGDIRRKDLKMMGESESEGKDGIDPTEEPIYDHGDIEMTTQMFSSVSATVHERLPHVVASPTVWQLVVEGLTRRYGVDIHDLVIQGSWLQVKMCRLMLMKIFNECLTHDVGSSEDHENATGRTSKTGSTERSPAVSGDIRRKDTKTMGESESEGKDGIDPTEEPIYEYHGSRHRPVAGALSHSRHHRAEAYTVVPWKTFEVASTRVHVHEGDITKLNVDVIVNAANGHLVHGGGVAGAIARAAGPDFTQECRTIIQERGEIYHGDGVMTSAGRLPCLAVYHVVGPMWDYFANKNDCLDILHQAFTSCLMASKDYSSIAIPAVSSGIYGVPSELVAQTMCEAVTKFCLGEEHQSRLRVIHLVDINTAMVKLIQENFELQSRTSEENSHKSAGMASILSGFTGVAGRIWKGLGVELAGTTKESVLDEGPFESGSPESPVERSEDDMKYKRNSSSLSDTGIKMDSAVISRGELTSGEGSGELRSHESHEERSEDDTKYKRSSSTTSLNDTDNKMGSVVMPGGKLASGEGSGDSPGKRPDDDGKHRSSSTSSLSDTDNKKGDIKSASMALPSSGDHNKLLPDTSFGRSPNERESRSSDDVGKTPTAKDHGRESYAAVVQGGTTSMTEKQTPDIGGVAGKQGGAAAASEGDGSDRGDLCPICLEMPDKPKILPTCKHKFCEVCINKCFDQKRECPVCRRVYGMLQGNQPKSGTMHSTICSTALPGYSCQTIVIEYSFPDGTQTREHPHPGQPFHGTRRTAYLPDNQDGRRILDLLKRAFKQRLTFTVGRSVTTGRDDVVTWNDIHHKTNQNGGPDGFGYPDEGYLQRVTEDLAAKGIK